MSQPTAKETRAAPTKVLAGHPLISQWVDLSAPGRLRVRSGRVELGQGVSLALRAIAADALSLPLDRVELVAGDTRECPNELYTAGSMSIEVGGVSLRAACLAARARLLERARELLQSPDAALDVAEGAILRDGAETGLDWWRLAAETPLDTPVLDALDPAEMHPRAAPSPALAAEAGRAIRARLGGGAYIHDLVLPGMIHARVLHLPHPRASLAELDAGPLETLPGVIALHRDGSFAAILAEEEAQAMAAVERADRAARWDIPDEGAPDATALLADADPPETMVEAGQPDAQGDAITVRAARPFLAHASIGTACALALWEGERLTVWSHAQGPHPLRAALALALGLDPEAVDVIHVPGAGCYGHNGADDVAFEAALLARAHPGRPVRLAWRRPDELTRGPLAPAMTTEATLRLAPDGTIAAMSLDILSAPHQRRPGPGKPNFAAGPLLADPVQPAPPTEPPPENGGGADRNAVPLYRLGGLRVTRRLATRCPVRTSAMRALGATINVTAIELAIDAAADRAGEGPLPFRLRHIDEPRARAVLERVAELASFTAETTESRAMGLGLARYKNKAGWCAVALELEAGVTLAVPRLWAVADVGETIDPEGVKAQVEGGAIQALSWSLHEAMPLENAAPAATDWESYPILTFPQVPEVAVELLSDPAHPPLGAGEIAQGPTSAALACAVRRLFGIDALSLPLTPDRLAAQIVS